ncbi:1,4-alpha-glucan branching protein GlgB [Angustibacter aerolatus]
MPRQRWFAAKGRGLRLVGDSAVTLARQGDTVVVLHLVEVELGDGTRQTYQVPLVLRRSAPREDDPAAGSGDDTVGATEGAGQAAPGLLGTVRAPDGGSWHVHDGPHDQAFVTALMTLVDAGGEAEGAGIEVRGARVPGGRPVLPVRGSRVLDGEQSNTSVIVDGPEPLICKVFRVLAPGDNPDVVVQSALTEAGSTTVPRAAGVLSGTWGAGDGHLAFVQEFLPGTRDAWRVALDAVRAGADFSAQAHGLGAATARVHLTLAEAFPTVATDDARRSTPVETLRGRLAEAVRRAPELAAREAAARAVLEDLPPAAALPALQRVHGDYHLGQVLDAGPVRGWVLLDFEGEPLRPLAERSEPDLALRDVAGMLRSFDYAAGHVVVAAPDGSAVDPAALAEQAERWSASCRDAFCRGYATVAGHDPREDAALLRALELDKALYEVVYETANRPAWLPIPLRAVDRLLGADAAARPTSDERRSDVTPTERPGTEPGTDPGTPATPQTATTSTATTTTSTATRTDDLEVRPSVRPVGRDELDRLVSGDVGDPHAVLGMHPHEGGITLRTLRPHAASVLAVLPDGSRTELEHEHEGVFVGIVPATEVTDYRLEVRYDDGEPQLVDDPYRFLPTLGEVDLHLIGEGRHEQLWNVLGAHVRRYPGSMGEVTGTSFAVWAPHARAVRLVGDLNHWDGRQHPMRSLGSSGVWELFVPGVGAGSRYKFEITGADGVRREKADPMARAAEQPPATASVVTESAYEWADDEWMTRRAQTDPHQGPMSTYELHLGSWREGLGYREMADQLVDYLLETGFTHVELMPVMQHPYAPSWGYHVTGYYAPDARFGKPDEFRYLVDRLHQAGIGVILDWVPGHFATDPWALVQFDGMALYEHPDPRRGWHNEWGSYIFDLGRPQVRNFLVANAIYWAEEFHCDGLRVDGVASMLYLDYSRKEGEWLPNQYGGRENLEAVQFLQETNATLYKRVPGVVTIAEESTAWPGVTRPTHVGGLGFGLKWNMGWMHDSLDYVAHEPVHRQYHHHQMTFSLMYAWSENYVLPISHDEVVHGKGSLLRKMPGDRWQQLATVRAYLATMWAHPGKQLLFMGSEFAQEAEWADGHGLDWWLLDQPAHRGVLNAVTDLNARYRELPALWSNDLSPDGFRWIDANDASSNVFSFLRFGTDPGDVVACVVNFSGSPREGYRLGLPSAGRWDEVLNTDAERYGGSGVGNLGAVEAVDESWHGLPASTTLVLPPLGAVWLRPAVATDD